MPNIQAIDAQKALNSQYSVYNGVKIRINNPQTNIPNTIKTGNGEYNSVSIEVNNPEFNIDKSVYSYPKAKDIVGFDKAGIKKYKNIPVIPVAYQTNLINNKTFINAELEVENKCDKNLKKGVSVPPPHLTTPEAEKGTDSEKGVSFHGINFRGVEPKITKAADIKPAVDIDNVLSNLLNNDYDTQAIQLEEIARVSLEDSKKAVPYVTTSVFSAITEIVNKDTNDLPGPTNEQTEIRKKIIANVFASEQSAAHGKTIDKTQLPFELSEEDIALANKLSPLEMAERNKEYGVYTLAALAKVYADETERKTGNIIPLTDMPGVSTFVDILKTSKNPSIKVAAINSFLHLRRPEYNDEIKSVIQVVTKDNNRFVAENAVEALAILG